MTETNYKVGIYLRLSREDERLGESGSISTQRDLLLNYIRDNNLIFVDEEAAKRYV
jgi:DNA invertase Pin-like site-specific DNA recombinase